MEKEIRRFNAVINHYKMRGKPCLLEGLLNEKDIAQVVFCPQYPDCRFVHSSSILIAPAILALLRFAKSNSIGKRRLSQLVVIRFRP
jgi:hypothetical protein